MLLEFSGFDVALASQITVFVARFDSSNRVIAVDAAERDALWHIRKSIPAAQGQAGASIKHDVSVPVSAIPELLNRGVAAVMALMPGLRPCPFGHLGDGNLHFNLSQPKDMAAEEFLAQWALFNRVIHDLVSELGGSIAAEHGVGQMKTGELQRYGDAGSLEMMFAIKQAFDPRGILNPGKLLVQR